MKSIEVALDRASKQGTLQGAQEAYEAGWKAALGDKPSLEAQALAAAAQAMGASGAEHSSPKARVVLLGHIFHILNEQFGYTRSELNCVWVSITAETAEILNYRLWHLMKEEDMGRVDRSANQSEAHLEIAAIFERVMKMSAYSFSDALSEAYLRTLAGVLVCLSTDAKMLQAGDVLSSAVRARRWPVVADYVEFSLSHETGWTPPPCNSGDGVPVAVDQPGFNLFFRHWPYHSLRLVPPGTEVHLESAEYGCSLPLVIWQPIRVVGHDKTLWRTGQLGIIAMLGESGSVSFDSVEFAGGEEQSIMVAVNGGTATFKRCRFVAGSHAQGLAVVHATADAAVDVSDCYFLGGGVGISVTNRASAALRRNSISMMKLGIAFADEASGTATENHLSLNGYAIQVAGTARPTLEKNTCQGNGWGGILYLGGAAGTATANLCLDNRGHGITVTEKAVPRIERNRCMYNQGCGILITSPAEPVLDANACADNKEVPIRDWRVT